MRQCYKQRVAPKSRRRRRRQRDQGISSIVRSAKKPAKNLMVRNVSKMALQKLNGVYDKDVKRMKNKKTKRNIRF